MPDVTPRQQDRTKAKRVAAVALLLLGICAIVAYLFYFKRSSGVIEAGTTSEQIQRQLDALSRGDASPTKTSTIEGGLDALSSTESKATASTSALLNQLNALDKPKAE